MENPIKMDDLGVPLFLETPIWGFYFPTLGAGYPAIAPKSLLSAGRFFSETVAAVSKEDSAPLI